MVLSNSIHNNGLNGVLTHLYSLLVIGYIDYVSGGLVSLVVVERDGWYWDANWMCEIHNFVIHQSSVGIVTTQTWGHHPFLYRLRYTFATLLRLIRRLYFISCWIKFGIWILYSIGNYTRERLKHVVCLQKLVGLLLGCSRIDWDKLDLSTTMGI